MTHALMIPAMRATMTMRNVVAAAAAAAVVVVVAVVVAAAAAAGDAGDMMTARGIMTVGIVIMTGAHAISTEGGMDMDVNHGITIVAMMIGVIELWSKKIHLLVVVKVHNLPRP
jgi:hypothetical protein